MKNSTIIVAGLSFLVIMLMLSGVLYKLHNLTELTTTYEECDVISEFISSVYKNRDTVSEDEVIKGISLKDGSVDAKNKLYEVVHLIYKMKDNYDYTNLRIVFYNECVEYNKK